MNRPSEGLRAILKTLGLLFLSLQYWQTLGFAFTPGLKCLICTWLWVNKYLRSDSWSKRIKLSTLKGQKGWTHLRKTHGGCFSWIIIKSLYHTLPLFAFLQRQDFAFLQGGQGVQEGPDLVPGSSKAQEVIWEQWGRRRGYEEYHDFSILVVSYGKVGGRKERGRCFGL